MGWLDDGVPGSKALASMRTTLKVAGKPAATYLKFPKKRLPSAQGTGQPGGGSWSEDKLSIAQDRYRAKGANAISRHPCQMAGALASQLGHTNSHE